MTQCTRKTHRNLHNGVDLLEGQFYGAKGFEIASSTMARRS